MSEGRLVRIALVCNCMSVTTWGLLNDDNGGFRYLWSADPLAERECGTPNGVIGLTQGEAQSIQYIDEPPDEVCVELAKYRLTQ